MKYGDDRNHIVEHDEADAVRKVPQHRLANVRSLDAELHRRALDGLESLTHGADEFTAESCDPLLIPSASILKIILSFRLKN